MLLILLRDECAARGIRKGCLGGRRSARKHDEQNWGEGSADKHETLLRGRTTWGQCPTGETALSSYHSMILLSFGVQIPRNRVTTQWAKGYATFSSNDASLLSVKDKSEEVKGCTHEAATALLYVSLKLLRLTCQAPAGSH